MTIKKFFAGSVLALFLFTAVPPVSHAASLADLEAQISVLVQMIAQFKAQAGQPAVEGISTSTLPSCAITVTPNPTKIGKTVTVSWTSENATKIEWVKDTSGKDNLKTPSSRPKLNGSRKFKMSVLGNPTLTLRVRTGDKTSTCSVTIAVVSKEPTVAYTANSV
jgi:type II secretory pathway pseudopilin PulG